jgi:hypothetical protein
LKAALTVRDIDFGTEVRWGDGHTGSRKYRGQCSGAALKLILGEERHLPEFDAQRQVLLDE